MKRGDESQHVHRKGGRGIQEGGGGKWERMLVLYILTFLSGFVVMGIGGGNKKGGG